MKNIFVVNPAAGKKKGNAAFIKTIETAAKNIDADFEVYVTKAAHDAEQFVRQTCETRCKSQPIRFFACGGDGTLNEVVNGAYGFDVQIGCIPIGSGNDFVRNFPDAGDFRNITAQLAGQPQIVDLIRYTQVVDGHLEASYCANMFNIGFDCNVVDMAAKLKKYPFIGGSAAYFLGIIFTLIKKTGIELRINFTDETNLAAAQVHDKKILLAAIANGCFCGGGFKGVPRATLDDGLIDVSIIENVPRITFLKLLLKYSKGTHLETSIGKRIITYKKCKCLTINVNGSTARMSTDGQITDIHNVHFESIPKAMWFSVPTALK